MVEIKNVREVPTTKEENRLYRWETIQLLTLGLTIIGQIVVGQWFILGQAAWLAANVVACCRNIALKRPIPDCVKDAAMLAITLGIIIAYFLGMY